MNSRFQILIFLFCQEYLVFYEYYDSLSNSFYKGYSTMRKFKFQSFDIVSFRKLIAEENCVNTVCITNVVKVQEGKHMHDELEKLKKERETYLKIIGEEQVEIVKIQEQIAENTRRVKVLDYKIMGYEQCSK